MTTDAPSGASEALGALAGRWSGSGHGEYPTIAPFDYVETVVFGQARNGILTYSQTTRSASDGRPMHAEQGYLRPAGPGRVEMVVAQPTGIVEVDEGVVASPGEGRLEIEVRSRMVAVTSSAKEVTGVERVLRIDADGVLRTRLSMAAVGVPLTHHLESELRREPGS